jgi:predicted Zn finger-like uncharacterized protein
MLVRCPKCRTTYKVSDEVLKGSASAFRCSRCKHTFELDVQSAAQVLQVDEADGAGWEKQANDEDLKLPFETRALEQSTPDGDKASLEDMRPREEGEVRRDQGSDAWSMSDPGRNVDRPFVMPGNDQPKEPGTELDTSRDFPDDDRFFPKMDSDDESPDSNNILALASYIDQRASILPFITLFGLLMIGFSSVAVISYAHPQASEQVLKQIPLVGSSVLKNERLKEGIVIQSLSSAYQTIQGNREVFLVTGVAVNQNPAVVREIRLSGIAYNEEGKELERQTIWAGNTISPKIIRGMTAEDIPHLQNLKPLKSFEVPPGDSIPFTIVFLRSTKNAKQFSCEVVAAEGDV